MSTPYLLLLLVVVGAPIALAQAHLVVRSELLPDDLTCRPLPLPVLVGVTGAPRVEIDVAGLGSKAVAVPRFRLRACMRLEHRERREQARQAHAAWIASAVAESTDLFRRELPKYLNVRYSGVRAGARAGQDIVRTGCAGCGGCARELSHGGNPLAAAGAGLEAAWNEKGEVHREFYRASLSKLLVGPIESVLGPAGPA